MLAGVFALLPFLGGSVSAATPAFGMLYYNDEIVRTTIPPSKTMLGLDDLYVVTNGVSEQMGIASVAPEDVDYHGGHWILNVVTFKDGVEPYLLSSEKDVLDAEDDGDIVITRNAEHSCVRYNQIRTSLLF